MRTQIVMASLAFATLVACSPKPATEETAASEAAPAPIPSPPPPPPFVDCTAQETTDVAAGISAWIGSHDTCVVNRTAITTTVSTCKKEVATGYIQARGTAEYSDTFMSNTYYAMDVVGQFGPTGAPIPQSINVNPNSTWLDACKLKGAIDGITKNSSDSEH